MKSWPSSRAKKSARSGAATRPKSTPLNIVSSPKAAAKWCRAAVRPLFFVPTMGALHAGHAALLKRARRLAGPRGSVVASVFVNPSQFGPNEDFSAYPRPFARDAALCRECGVDMLFHPTAEAMYAADVSTSVVESQLCAGFCGISRSGHFSGVCTVVAKLFNIVAPDAAVFGEKDFQQLAIIRRMVRDLNFPIKIIGAPTVREADGLALSSRNEYLSDAQRKDAAVIWRALSAAASAKTLDPKSLKAQVVKIISESAAAKIDYVEVVDAETLQPATRQTNNKRIMSAVFFGRTRLIDNIAVPAK